MNRLSIRVLLIAGLVTLSGTSFSNKATVEASPTQGMLYYWYFQPYDQFNDRKTLNDEVYELWVMFGVLIDQSPSNLGTLLVKGYFNDAFPHNQVPLKFLYGHFWWIQ